MSERDSPQMSVVIVADHYETIRKTMRHIRAQTVRDRLEIVMVTQSANILGLDPAEVADFLHVRVSEVDAIISLSPFRRAARV